MSGLFGSLFDFNGDGELSTGEKAFGFAAIMSALSALEDAEVSVSCSFDDKDLDDMDRDELEVSSGGTELTLLISPLTLISVGETGN